MSTPGNGGDSGNSGDIELNYDTATGAAAELLGHAQAIEEIAAKFQEAVEQFKADARLDGDVLPASKATLALLNEQASKVRTVIGEITSDVDLAGNALNGRVAEAQSSEAHSVSVIEALGTAGGGTPR